MRSLTIFLCGSNSTLLKNIARTLAIEGVTVQTSTDLVDCLRLSDERIDFLLIELDGLYGHLLGLLPTLRRNAPNLPIIGLFTRDEVDPLVAGLAYSLELDDYWFETPRPDELIMRFPQIANKYLYETKSSLLINSFTTLEQQFRIVLRA
ncbi:MAG: hypothetical protein KDI79_31940 [Anaerolineae bacterium]|nr:hypothetical protein [Anaerolineae bacterium]